MIARAGLFHFERGERAPLDLNAFATLPHARGLVERVIAAATRIVHPPRSSVALGPLQLTGFGLAVLLCSSIAQVMAQHELRAADTMPSP